MKKIMVSACLMGRRCKYNGETEHMRRAVKQAGKNATLMPICPEMWSGFSCPRKPLRRQKGRLMMEIKPGHFIDVTNILRMGMGRVIGLSKGLGIASFILRKDSPTCGRRGLLGAKLIDSNADIMFL
jgi:uncharacterized protein YbbK (DUF523 family)